MQSQISHLYRLVNALSLREAGQRSLEQRLSNLTESTMDRRRFIKIGIALPTAAALPWHSVLAADQPSFNSVTCDRSGHREWNLFRNSGSKPIATTGAIPVRSFTESGAENLPPGKVGISTFTYAESVTIKDGDTGKYRDDSLGLISLVGRSQWMANSIQLWSGKFSNDVSTPARANYYVTLTAKVTRGPRAKGLYIFCHNVAKAWDYQDGPTGSHTIRIFQDATNKLLFEDAPTPDHFGWIPITEYDNLLGPNDVIRIEVIAQCDHVNNGAPRVEPRMAGSVCGLSVMRPA